MANTNCLAGRQCPKCGHKDDFVVQVSVRARLIDNGVEEYFGDTEFDEDAPAECGACHHSAKWWMFSEDAQRTEAELSEGAADGSH